MGSLVVLGGILVRRWIFLLNPQAIGPFLGAGGPRELLLGLVIREEVLECTLINNSPAEHSVQSHWHFPRDPPSSRKRSRALFYPVRI